MGESDEERSARQAILERRRRFVTAALGGLATGVSATACPCLKMAAPRDEPATEQAPADSPTEPPTETSPEASTEASPETPTSEGEAPKP